MNLTPEQLAAYQAYVQAHQGTNAAYVDPTTGQTIMDAGGSGWNGGGDGALSVGNYKPGGSYSYYDSKGNDTGQKGLYGDNKSLMGELLKYGLILGGVGAAGGMFGGAGLFGGGGGTGLGAANGSWDVLPEAIGGGAPNTAAMGAGNGFTWNAAADSQAASAALGDAAYTPLGSGAAGTGVYGNPLDPAYASMGGAGTGAATNAATTAATTAAANGSKLASLLGPAAAVLGGLAGAQGQKAGGTAEHKMDPRLDPAVFGEGGLVPRAQGLLAQQMDPARMAGYRQMQTAGMGLLNQPVAGNGFSRFSSR